MMAVDRPRQYWVLALSAAARRGWLRLGRDPGAPLLPCDLGRSGRRAVKREGDGATPMGAFPVRALLYRADRIPHPRSLLAARPIRPDDGWCDAPADRNYNRAVRHPYPASAERLWRDDGLYDLVVVLGANDVPRRRGMGSAIFVHVARKDRTPTAGCLAFERQHLLRLLSRLRRGDRIVTRPR